MTKTITRQQLRDIIKEELSNNPDERIVTVRYSFGRSSEEAKDDIATGIPEDEYFFRPLAKALNLKVSGKNYSDLLYTGKMRNVRLLIGCTAWGEGQTPEGGAEAELSYGGSTSWKEHDKTFDDYYNRRNETVKDVRTAWAKISQEQLDKLMKTYMPHFFK
jgi:hypothetical protein